MLAMLEWRDRSTLTRLQVNTLTIIVKMATKIIDNMINWDESFNQTASEYIYEYGDDDDKDGGDDNGCSYYF